MTNWSNSVVPIFYYSDAKPNERQYDGSGFFIEIDAKLVLVTCRHVIEGDSLPADAKWYILLQETEVSIKQFKFGGNLFIKLGKLVTGDDSYFINDYAFAPFEAKEYNITPVPLIDTNTLTKGATVTLITHTKDKMDSFEGTRINMSECLITRHRPFSSSTEIGMCNAIKLNFPTAKIEKGHSGGLIVDGNNNCVGFLASGGPNEKTKEFEVFMLKAETIVDIYQLLILDFPEIGDVISAFVKRSFNQE